MSTRWRIIDTGAQSPSTNMALDEAILRGYELHSSPPTLRIYRWKPSGISIGYFQDPKEALDLEACRSQSVPVVRRITGGGIILHGDELTYSFVCSREDLGIPNEVTSSYKTICSFLIKFYKSLGIEAGFASDIPSGETLGRPSTLCFAAKEKYDIVVKGRKMGGNAQKRLKDVIFQHGSIPFSVDTRKVSSLLHKRVSLGDLHGPTSLREIMREDISVPELSELLIKSFTGSFNLEAFAGRISSEEDKIFTDLKRLKYENPDWNLDRVEAVGACV